MQQRFIDDLSKQLARAVSRRDMLGIASRAILGAFITSTGIGKLLGQSTATLTSSPVCPTCGTCQVVNVTTGEVRDCERPCMAKKLCEAANRKRHYRILEADLGDRYYQNQSYQAVITVGGSVQTTILQTNYTKQNDLAASATLHIAQQRIMNDPFEMGDDAFDDDAPVFTGSTEYASGIPQFAYAVNEGQIQQILPFQFEEAVSVLSAATSSSQLQSLLPTCHSVCNFGFDKICDYGFGLPGLNECLGLAIPACTELVLEFPILGAAGWIACVGIGTYICVNRLNLVHNAICKPFVDAACSCLCRDVPCGQTLFCPQCPPDFNCSGGICWRTCSQEEYPCSTIGPRGVLNCCKRGTQDCCAGQCLPAHTDCCSNGPGITPCVTQCCVVGEKCVNGHCVPCSPCGTDCCVAGEVCSGGTTCVSCPPAQACGVTCCPSPSTCLNGQCICPSGHPVCGGTTCCDSGTCQNGTCTCGGSQCSSNSICCPFGYHGAGAAPGPSFCPGNYTCCPSYTGPTLQAGSCCPPGQECCPFANNTGCCPSGTQCCPNGFGSNFCVATGFCCPGACTPNGGCAGVCLPGWSCCPGVVISGLNSGCCPPGTTCVGGGTASAACM